MKRIIAVVITIVLVLAMTACGQSDRIHVYADGYDDCYHLNGLEESNGFYDAYTEEEGKIHIEDGIFWIYEGEETCPFCDGED